MSELITADEAQQIAEPGLALRYRTTWLVVLGVLIVLIGTLVVMIFLSSRGVATGLGDLLPHSSGASNLP